MACWRVLSEGDKLLPGSDTSNAIRNAAVVVVWVRARRGSNTTITASDLTDTDTVLLVQSRNLSIEAYSEPTTVTYSGE